MNKHLSYILPAFILATMWFGSRWAYDHHKLLIDITFPAIAVILISLHINIVRFITELNSKLQIKKQFGSYLSPKMVEQLQKNPCLLKLGGESKELSILFGDIRGFTSISEYFGQDVQGLTKIMNRLMTAITKPVLMNNGMVDKYIGDCIMAEWNAPLDDKNHAKNAVKTALQMLESLDEFNREIAAEGVPAFGMGLGINTGTVVVGNMGSEQRFDYTCLGDHVNLASRLEGQSKPYSVRIVIGPRTAEQIKDQYFVLKLDCMAVKGKTEGVNIYTVLVGNQAAMLKSTRYSTARKQHNDMLRDYELQKFDEAIESCKDLQGQFSGQLDSYYAMWIARCRELQNTPLSKDWDGIFRATNK